MWLLCNLYKTLFIIYRDLVSDWADTFINNISLMKELVGWEIFFFIISLLSLIWFHRPSSGSLTNADFRQDQRALRAEVIDHTAAKTIANATLFNWMCISFSGLISLTFLLLFRRFRNCDVFDYVVVILILRNGLH